MSKLEQKKFIRNLDNRNTRIILIVVCAIIFYFISFSINSSTNSSTNVIPNPSKSLVDDLKPLAVEETQPVKPDLTSEVKMYTYNYVSYDNTTYTFEIISSIEDKRIVATFSPFIPNKYDNLIESILRVFIVNYGENALIDPTPLSESRNGTNLIKFNGDEGIYYVLPVKEDTGEIHSIVFWME